MMVSDAWRSAAACRKADRNGSRSLRISQPVTRMDRLADGEQCVYVKFSTEDAEFYLVRSEEHTSELQSRLHLVCRLLLEKKKHLGDRANYPARAVRGP